MKCDCRKHFEKKISEKLIANLPEGYKDFNADLGCYGIGITDSNNLITIMTIPYRGSVMIPNRSGGMKKKKIETFLRANFCPFCGKPADKIADARGE